MLAGCLGLVWLLLVWFPWAWALLGLLVSVSGGSPVALLARFPCLWLPVVPGFLAALLSLFLSVLSGLAFGFARLPVPFSFRFVVGLWPVLFSLPCFVARLLACPLACLSVVVSRLCLCALGVGFPGSGLVFVRSFVCLFGLFACWVGCCAVGRVLRAFSVLRSPCSSACWCWPAPLLLACESATY